MKEASQWDLTFPSSISIREVQISFTHISGVSPNNFKVLCQKTFEYYSSYSASSFTDKIADL